MRKVLAVGSIGIIVLLVFTVFPSIISAQITKPNIKIQHEKDRITDIKQTSGSFFSDLIILLLIILWSLLGIPWAP